MNIARLEGFFYVARNRSFRQAARLFPYPITPAGLHQQVNRLETELGVKLLRRLNRNEMALTAEGQTLFDFVQPFIEGLPQVAQKLAGSELHGSLRLMSSIHLLKYFLPKALNEFQKEFSGIAVSFLEAREPDVSQVWMGQVDLFIDFVPNLLPGLLARQVGQLQACVAIPKSLKLKKFSMEQLSELSFVAYAEGRSNRLRQLEGLASFGLRPPRILSAESSESILGLVAGGLGYSIVPMAQDVKYDIAGVELIPLARKDAVFPISAVFRKNDAQNQMMKRFLDKLGT
jgi:DNA-binding transcriptional LysR family regulator